MTKRFRDDDEDEDDELKPVFVDTSLDTHLVVLVSPLLSFSLLKERIVMEHFNCFPNFGEIKIDALKVKREQKYYHLSDSMLIKVAFHGVEGWFVYADVSVTSFDKPSKALSITVKKLQPNLTLQKHVPTLQMPENAYKNIEKEAAKSDSPGDDPRQHGKKSSKRHKTETTPVKSTPKFEDNNARKASLMETQGIVLPSKVVEVSAAGDVDTSSVSTDAAAETDTAKRRCEVLRQSEGTVKSLKTLSSDLNQETAVHIVSRVKKFRRKLKGDGDGVDKSHVLKSGEGPDITRNDVSAFDSGKITSGKGINDEDVTPLKSSEVEVTESENTSKKMKTSKGSRRENNDLESANTTLKGTSTNAGGFCNEVSEVDNPVAASGSPAKKKKKNKKDVDGVNGRDAAQLGRVPDVMQNGVTTLDSETLGISEIESDNKRTGDAEIEKSEDIAKKKKKKTHKTKTSVTENEDLSTPRHNNDRELSDSRQEVAEFSQKGFSKTEQSADTMSKSEDEAKKKKKKTHKTKTSVTENEGLSSPRHNNDRELAGSRQEAAEFLQTGGIIKTEQSADTMSKSEDEAKKKKKKTHKTKTSVTENVDLSTPRHNNDREVADSRQEAAEFSQTGGISKIEQSADTLSKSRARSPSKQKSHLEDSSGFPLKERFNEKMKENAAPETVTNDCLREKGTNDAADQSQMHHEDLNNIPANVVSADVAEGTKVDKPTESKKKKKKSKENEKTPEVVPQIITDNLEAAGTEEIGAELLQPARSSKTEEISELKSVKPKKKSKSKQTASVTDVPEIPVTESVDEDKPADDSLLTNGSVSGDKNQSKSGDVERENRNGISVQTADAHEREILNPEKQTANKSKRKKLDQPSVVDTSSNLMTSEKGHQLQSEVPEAKKTSVTVVESFPPPQDNNPEVNKEIQNDKPKKKQNKKHSSSEKKTKQFDIEIQKTVVEQADDVMQYSNVNEAEKLEEVSTHQKSRNDSTEVSKLGSRLASKSKGKKLDISSSVDTSSNSHSLTTSKKSRESAKIIAQVLSELQNDVQESELSRPIDVHLSQLHQTSQHEDCLETLDTESVKQMVQPKTTFSANVLPEAEQPDVLLTKSNRAAKHSKGTPLTEGHDNDPVEILSQEVSSGSKTTKPEKLTASKRKVKNLDLPTAKDAESKEENSTASNKKSTCGNNSLDGSQLQKSITKSKRVLRFHSSTDHSKSSKDVETQVPTGNQNNTVGKTDATYPNMDGNRSSETSSLISGSSVKRTRMGKSTVEVRKKKKHENVYKTPANKVVEVPVNAVPQKKYVPPTTGGLFGDLSSDSSDGEVIRSGSSSSTRTPDDVSSSDYSEGESKGDVVTSQHDSKGGGSARDKTNTTSSALMEMNLESVLRSSRRYKKAKLVASQSQMEDGESEPPEFVPDSLAYE